MPWTKPTRPKAYRELKELRPVFGHELNTVLKDLGLEVREGEAIGPVVLWVGVTPETLSIKVTHTTVHSCMGRLEKVAMGDVRASPRSPTSPGQPGQASNLVPT
ncbi:hypothetical protein BS47DRAFT_1396386 [Hydnum rufescens UP504]|uniref:Uncharacterized protein n=1 Tax=Hydnum rufescens UP504 TaxID=1448309 RepID=A0A9P6AQT4_9AGAM|nr:hypothetical protein BS47DRAFT_1396386 [Hydnum rufescens UP504]